MVGEVKWLAVLIWAAAPILGGLLCYAFALNHIGSALVGVPIGLAFGTFGLLWWWAHEG